VTLSAPHTTTSWDDREPGRTKFDLPLLYLHREREATAAAERTLDISIVGPAARSEIQTEALSRHVDIFTGEPYTATQRFLLPDHPCTSETPCTVRWTFDPGSTYSDFYDLRVKDAAGNLLWEKRSPDRPDFVLLDTWDVGLGQYTVRVYYAALFPFAKATNRLVNKLPPSAVADFIEFQFVPIIIDTWHTQFQVWGFGDAIHPDWDLDKVVEIFVTDSPFALFDGIGTYHSSTYKDGRRYPQRRLWWRATNNSFQVYDSLEEAYRAVLAHELFHLAQWNVVLSAGCSANRWLNLFIEAQGKFAPSVMYPEMELGHQRLDGLDSEYGGAANRFLALGLNSSFKQLEAEKIDKYDFALYWRFLYEQSNGMGIIRAALEEMACHSDADIVRGIKPVMDRAFQRSDGPFRTFEESLIAFARANFALRLENGRCRAADPADCGEFYFDPNHTYVDPPLEAELAYNGASLTYNGAIPSSFGMDFIEVKLDPTLHNQPLKIKLQGEGAVARYNVQVWQLASGATRPWAVTPQPETVPQDGDGAHVYTVPHLDTAGYQRLALIITRLDADETADPAGSYRIVLE
jgi:hypothetical protein